MNEFSKIVSHELLESLHCAIRNIKILCSLPHEPENVRYDEAKKIYDELYDKYGDQLKKVVNQFIDLQLKTYKEFDSCDDIMYWYRDLMWR